MTLGSHNPSSGLESPMELKKIEIKTVWNSTQDRLFYGKPKMCVYVLWTWQVPRPVSVSTEDTAL